VIAYQKLAFLVTFGLVSTLLTACAATTPRQAQVSQADSTMITGIKKITLLPLVTRVEIEKEESSALIDRVHKLVGIELANKGYVLTKSTTFSDTVPATAPLVYEMSTKDLTTLGPTDARYVLIPYLREVSRSYIVVAKSTEVKVSAILVDKQTNTILWQDESTGSLSTSLLQLGLVGILLMNEDVGAVSRALANLFRTFPAKNGAH